MLITASLAAVVLTSALAAAAPVTAAPPMTVSVSASQSIPATLVTRVLAETDAVWRAAGLTFVWRRDPPPPAAAAIEPAPCPSPTLRVVIGVDRASDAGKRTEGVTALGWIVFDEDRPASEVYLSYDNSVAFMAGARGVVGLTDRMTLAEYHMLLSRAMGRALAHEIGHYLLASKAHSVRGLMRATHTAAEFFGFERSGFVIDAAQRRAVADRLRENRWLAMQDLR